jgi:hypothetical protein
MRKVSKKRTVISEMAFWKCRKIFWSKQCLEQSIPPSIHKILVEYKYVCSLGYSVVTSRCTHCKLKIWWGKNASNTLNLLNSIAKQHTHRCLLSLVREWLRTMNAATAHNHKNVCKRVSEDQAKFKVCFLINAYHFHSIIKSNTHMWNYGELGSVCIY